MMLFSADVLPPMTPLPEDGRRIRFRKEQAAVLYHYLTVWVKKYVGGKSTNPPVKFWTN